MAKILLYCGGVALVDDQDLPLVQGFNWTLDSEGYVIACTKTDGEWKIVKLHKLIFEDQLVDHWNHDKVDNRRQHLRLCTKAQNCANRSKTKSVTTSIFKGVSWDKQQSKWRATLHTSAGGTHKSRHLGRFTSERDAAISYNNAATAKFGEFACLNTV